MTYQTTIAQQRNFDFFAFFSALYLVVSDILLTHNWRLVFYIFFHPTRAKRALTLVNKGLHGVSFVRFFVPFCELDIRQNKNEITAILINIQTGCANCVSPKN